MFSWERVQKSGILAGRQLRSRKGGFLLNYEH